MHSTEPTQRRAPDSDGTHPSHINLVPPHLRVSPLPTKALKFARFALSLSLVAAAPGTSQPAQLGQLGQLAQLAQLAQPAPPASPASPAPVGSTSSAPGSASNETPFPNAGTYKATVERLFPDLSTAYTATFLRTFTSFTNRAAYSEHGIEAQCFLRGVIEEVRASLRLRPPSLTRLPCPAPSLCSISADGSGSPWPQCACRGARLWRAAAESRRALPHLHLPRE